MQGRRERRYAGISARLRTPQRAARRVPAAQGSFRNEFLLVPAVVHRLALRRRRLARLLPDIYDTPAHLEAELDSPSGGPAVGVRELRCLAVRLGDGDVNAVALHAGRERPATRTARDRVVADRLDRKQLLAAKAPLGLLEGARAVRPGAVHEPADELCRDE